MKDGCSAPLALLLAATVWASLSAARPDQSRPPANLRVASALRVVVDAMWQASPTFRRQCRRLSAEPSLLVTLSRANQSPDGSYANAWTALTFKEKMAVAAQVNINSDSNVAELIAHELEHILEQLDGVDLQAQAGNGVVWKSGKASFETRRAIEAGRRVAREIVDGGKALERAKVDSSTVFDMPQTLELRDHDATITSPFPARVSSDGRYVVFTSTAQLSEDDHNQQRDVYVTDVATGRTTLESAGADGEPSNGDSVNVDISGDGRYIVFESGAHNLTGRSYPSRFVQVFLRDRQERTTRLLSESADGRPGNGRSANPVISANGAVVAFESGATDLPATLDGSQPSAGIYAITLATGVHTRIDVTSAGTPAATGSSMSPSISADGRYVAFASRADLTCQETTICAPEPPDLNRQADIYVRDLETGQTRRVSRSHEGGDANGASYDPAISGDGRVIAFVSEASNLIRDPLGHSPQIYIHDLASRRTELVSRTDSGRPGNGRSLHPTLSSDGTVVAFQSLASDLLCEQKCGPPLEDINLLWDVFVHNRATNRTTRVSTDAGDEWMESSLGPSIDGAGRIVAFGSWHPTGATDTAHDEDLYIVHMEMLNAEF